MEKRILYIIYLFLFLSSLQIIFADSNSTSLSEWKMFGRTLDNNRYYPAEVNMTRFGVLWNHDFNNIISTNGSVISDGIIYVGDKDGILYALNASTGSSIWNYTTLAQISGSSPALSNSIIFIGNKDGKLFALNATTGIKIWNYSMDAMITSSPAISNNILYVGCWDNNIYALNATTGVKIWNYTTGVNIVSSPAISNNIVYIGDFNGNMYALNATTGIKIWNYTMDAKIMDSSPAISKGILYIGGYYGKVYALNASTGDPIWNYVVGSQIISSVTINSDIVYIGNLDSDLYAFNASSGVQIWNYTSESGIKSSSTSSVNMIYFGSGNNLYALNATTGVQIWNYTVSSGSEFNSPAIADGILYITYNNRLYAFKSGTVPEIILNNPINNYSISNRNVTFNFTATDDSNDMNCNLIINNVVNLSNLTITNNIPYTTSLILQQGNYNWSVSCNDSLGNIGYSEIRNFNIDTTAPIINDSLVNLTLNLLNDGSVNITWNNDTQIDVIKYNIYRKTIYIEPILNEFFLNSGDTLTTEGIQITLVNCSGTGANLRIDGNMYLLESGDKLLYSSLKISVIEAFNEAGEENDSAIIKISDTIEPVDNNDRVAENITNLNWVDNNTKQSNTTYYYVLTAVDEVGNENKSAITNVINITTPSSCTNDYSCDGWSTCSSSLQSRSCSRNCYLEGGVNLTIESQSCSSGSGGSSGGGGGSNLDTSNLASTSTTLPEMKINLPSIIKVDNEKAVGFYEATINVNENLENIKVTFAKVDTTPTGTEAPKQEEKVFKYIQISLSSGKEKIKQANLKFKVEKSWLEQNKLDKNLVRLFRYTTQWDELSTKISKEDTTYVYFEAITPGFSYFKISTIQKNEIIIQTTQNITNNTLNKTNMLENNNIEENKTKNILNNSEKKLLDKDNSYSPYLIIGLIIVILLTIIIILLSVVIFKKDKKKKIRKNNIF